MSKCEYARNFQQGERRYKKAPSLNIVVDCVPMSELSNFIVFVSGSASKRGSLAGGSETGQAGLPAAFPPPGPGRPGDIQGNTDKLYEEQYAQYYRYGTVQYSTLSFTGTDRSRLDLGWVLII